MTPKNKKKKTVPPKDKSIAQSLPPRPANLPPEPNRAGISPREYTAMTNFPELYSEETASGNMPNPESDDDTIKDIQEWGFYLDADDEHPKEINIQQQIDKAEKARKRKRDQIKYFQLFLKYQANNSKVTATKINQE